VYIYSFLHAALWFNQEISSVKKLTNSTMQTKLRTHELHWQQPWHKYFIFISNVC